MSQIEIAWTSFDSPARIIKINNTDRNRFHPIQKPIALYDWIFNNYAVCKKCHNEGGFYENVVGDGGSKMYVECEYCNIAEEGNIKILDTHLGSGSSRIAAHKAGLDFIGCELDKDYFEAQEKRYKDFISQLTLF